MKKTLSLVLAGASFSLHAQEALPTVVIEASRQSQLGTADAAGDGSVTQEQLQARTTYRPGELLEAVPGLIVSQHSGEGKANQFYLCGFNLDHGTDLRTTDPRRQFRPVGAHGAAGRHAGGNRGGNGGTDQYGTPEPPPRVPGRVPALPRSISPSARWTA